MFEDRFRYLYKSTRRDLVETVRNPQLVRKSYMKATFGMSHLVYDIGEEGDLPALDLRSHSPLYL